MCICATDGVRTRCFIAVPHILLAGIGLTLAAVALGIFFPALAIPVLVKAGLSIGASLSMGATATAIVSAILALFCLGGNGWLCVF